MTALATETSTDQSPLWFLDSLVEIRAGRATGEPVSVLEMTVPAGDTSPLHLQDEDERIYVLSGAVTFYVGDEVIDAQPGHSVFIPRGRLHAHRASAFGARWLVLTASGRFEEFVRSVSRPAARPSLPPNTGPLRWEDAERLTRIGLAHGIEYFGPPGSLPADL